MRCFIMKLQTPPLPLPLKGGECWRLARKVTMPKEKAGVMAWKVIMPQEKARLMAWEARLPHKKAGSPGEPETLSGIGAGSPVYLTTTF